jgi:single-strand DNA-binding protein
MNSANITGRLTADPELKTTGKGDKMCRVTVAVDRETAEKEADFIRVVTFRQSAEFLSNYCNKGDTIGVSGKIRTGSYEDRDGKKIYTTDIFADRVEKLHATKAKDTPSGGPSVYLKDVKPEPGPEQGSGDEELPF